MIPIKNPNISTNRYKELLQIEKYYEKNLKINRNLREENNILKRKVYDYEYRLDNAIEIIEKVLYEWENHKENKVGLNIKGLLDILKGENNE